MIKSEEVAKGKEWVVRLVKFGAEPWAVEFTILCGFHQGFRLENFGRNSKKEARWAATMLARALTRLESGIGVRPNGRKKNA